MFLMQMASTCVSHNLTYFEKTHQSHYHVLLLLFSAALKLLKPTILFASRTILCGGLCFLVGHSTKCMNFHSQRCMMCQKLGRPPTLKMNFETNNDQNDLKLYRYQCTLEKVVNVKGKVSITFTFSFRLVNVYRY